MLGEKKRIKHTIVLPSIALSQFLHKTVFDEASFALFMENTVGALEKSGIKLDATVSDDALMRLRFLVERARTCVIKEKINSVKFEELFGISVAHAQLQDLTLNVRAQTQSDAAVDVYYAEQKSESNRGSNTDFNGSGTVSESRTDHYSTTNFSGRQVTLPEERFTRVPLLDALSLGTLIAKVDVQLKELGNY
jgi:hypothetical protein